MPPSTVVNFMLQQGFAEEPFETCDMLFEALYFQPRIVFPFVVVAIGLQFVSVPASVALHLAISGVLWWNTLLPALNPFELAYNRLVAGPRGRASLGPAPVPRRFAQGMAAALLLAAGLALAFGVPWLAWIIEALVAVAFSALLFGRFCLGAYVYHVLKGRLAFANSTLPWARR